MAATNKRPSTRKPTILKPSKASSIKSLFRKHGNGMSLKQWMRAYADSHNDPTFNAAVTDWLHNKRANTANPQLCLGKTRRKKAAGGKKKEEPTNTRGR